MNRARGLNIQPLHGYRNPKEEKWFNHGYCYSNFPLKMDLDTGAATSIISVHGHIIYCQRQRPHFITSTQVIVMTGWQETTNPEIQPRRDELSICVSPPGRKFILAELGTRSSSRNVSYEDAGKKCSLVVRDGVRLRGASEEL